jgi:hypothetical protein
MIPGPRHRVRDRLEPSSLSKIEQMKTGNKFANPDKIYLFFIESLWKICVGVTSQDKLSSFTRDYLTPLVVQCTSLTVDSQDITHEAMDPLLRVIVMAFILNVSLPVGLAHVMEHMESTDITRYLENTVFKHKFKRPFDTLLHGDNIVLNYITDLKKAVTSWREKNYPVLCTSEQMFKEYTKPKISLWSMCLRIGQAVLYNVKSWMTLRGGWCPILLADVFKMSAAFAEAMGFYGLYLKFEHRAEKLNKMWPFAVRLKCTEKIILCVLSMMCMYYMYGWTNSQTNSKFRFKVCLFQVMLKPVKHLASFGFLLWSVPTGAAAPATNHFSIELDWTTNDKNWWPWNYTLAEFFAFPSIGFPTVEHSWPNIQVPIVNNAWPEMKFDWLNYEVVRPALHVSLDTFNSMCYWINDGVNGVKNRVAGVDWQETTLNMLNSLSDAFQPVYVAGSNHLAYLANQTRQSKNALADVLTNMTTALNNNDWIETSAKTMWDTCKISTEVAVWKAPELGLIPFQVPDNRDVLCFLIWGLVCLFWVWMYYSITTPSYLSKCVHCILFGFSLGYWVPIVWSDLKSFLVELKQIIVGLWMMFLGAEPRFIPLLQ